MSTIVRMTGITEAFPGVLANDHIDFTVEAGEVHALLGENGAGKTTLMNILYGLYQPDEGEIYINGQRVVLHSPKDAINLGMGMVHQHFMLIPPFSVAENIVLALKSSREPFLDDSSLVAKRISDLATKYCLSVDPEARIWQLSVGQQQRVEILKSLYRGARLLILDEPTAVLTPQEVKELLQVLRSLVAQGNSVIFITHKLDEVMQVSDRVTVLRDGKVVGTLKTADASKRGLARMMVGREMLSRLAKKPLEAGPLVLEVKDLLVLNDKRLPAVKDVSLTVRRGEILGIAGVDGNGQRELSQAITGLREVASGRIYFHGQDITGGSPQHFIALGGAHIPEDRYEMGLIMDFDLAENAILGVLDKPPFAKGLFLDQSAIEEHAQNLIVQYDVRTPSISVLARNLSGGNAQKLLLARELSRSPSLIVAVQPTRGLDVGATEYVQQQLVEHRNRGAAVLLISTELDEILMLSDRVAVMYEGGIMGVISSDHIDIEEIGLMMAGARRVSTPPQEGERC
ncbi:MAG: ABC transporter ATP-binding protein [Chloroflexi bacterium]|nr:ABC transporter ATP-binding protein [Chloroflexota bacterium]MCL5076131.1 ABC transporter ATP-binding protein [Chloroflexota bacterium]